MLHDTIIEYSQLQIIWGNGGGGGDVMDNPKRKM
jgi:hypothetical protein